VITASRIIHTGVPEDLVLAGVLEKAFPSHHVIFDLTTGTFRVPLQVQGKVALVGRGLHAYWTRRALERTGWQVVNDARKASVTVRLLRNGARPRWLIQWQHHKRICHSLADVLLYLKLNVNVGPSEKR